MQQNEMPAADEYLNRQGNQCVSVKMSVYFMNNTEITYSFGSWDDFQTE